MHLTAIPARIPRLRRLAVLLGAFTALAGSLSAGTYTVSSATDSALRAAVVSANADAAAAVIDFNIPGGGTITLTSMLPVLSNPNGITINGANGGQGAITISGGSTDAVTGDRIFFVGIGADTTNANLPVTTGTTFTMQNLTLSNGNARGGSGGAGSLGAGGGAGFGGAIFVNAGTLALVNVSFLNHKAVGGAGGTSGSTLAWGGGGGMGGNGAAGVTGNGTGGGGGFGIGANGGAGFTHPVGFTGTFANGTFGGNGGGAGGSVANPGGAGGPSGGGGGAGPWIADLPGGGGGGVGGQSRIAGGAGGFGGGGGGGSAGGYGGGMGGFGGGAGGGGGGGSVFGGGGGGGNSLPTGFGGGGAASSGTQRQGGGGAAFGGTVFVRSGAGLNVGTGVTSSGGSVTGGVGANNGQAIAPNLFIDAASAPGLINLPNGATLTSNDAVAVRINGVGVAGTAYSQLVVTGNVSLGNATLLLTGGYVPALGDTFVVVNNDASDPVTGTFSGLPEGATVVFNGVNLTLSYRGGSGNDVTLTRVAPTPPLFTSGNVVVFTIGNGSSFTVSASGVPAPTLSASGTLPSGVTFTPATGALGGTPAPGTGGIYPLVFTAQNGNTPNATQNFTLTINRPPVAGNDTLATNRNNAVSLPVSRLLLNDSDADGDVITLQSVSATSAQGGSVTVVSGTLTYTPLITYTGADSFTYTISDGRGGVASGTVSVTVTDNGGAPSQNFVGLTFEPGLGTRLRWQGIVGYAYRMEYTDDLGALWTPLAGSVTAGSTGQIEFIDPTDPRPPQRFYRTVTP